MYDLENVGKTIKSEREKRKWSQEKLGKKLGVTGKQISNYEKSILLPPMDILLKMCNVFGCELGYLLGEENYSEGTALLTAIKDYCGLSAETVERIRKLSYLHFDKGHFEEEKKKYCDYMNRIIMLKGFGSLVCKMEYMEDAIYRRDHLHDAIIDKYGNETYKKAFELLYGPIDYEHDENAPTLDEATKDAMVEINALEEKAVQNTQNARMERFEMEEILFGMMEELFPKNGNAGKR